MKFTATTATLGLLAFTASASIVDSVVDSVQEVIRPGQDHFHPDITDQNFPCCTTKCTGGCPQGDGVSISLHFNGPPSFKSNPPGCGEGFAEQQCLQFFQITLESLHVPLAIAGTNANLTDTSADESGKFGCGTGSSAGECLTYLMDFFKEIKKPLRLSLGNASIVSADSDAPVADDASASGKSEL